MPSAHILGFPRIGARRELKTTVEAYWRGELDEAQLHETGRQLRQRHWALQKAAGLDFVSVGDFALYDHVHNFTALISAAPERFALQAPIDPTAYFAMARGTVEQPALALKKWFDTNYHYLVPEIDPHTRFILNPQWLLPELREAKALGYKTKVVIPGPTTWLWLASAQAGADRLRLLPALLEVYGALLGEIKQAGAQWVQVDEPILSLDLPRAWLDTFASTYASLSAAGCPILLATYFGSVAQHAAMLEDLPIAGLHLDLVRAPEQRDAFLEKWPVKKILSMGVVDGRNLWRADLTRALAVLRPAHDRLGDTLWISASCSLLHVPTDLALETKLDREIRGWMAFAVQKLDEIGILKRALNEGEAAVRNELGAAAAALKSRRDAPATHRNDVRKAVFDLVDESARRTPAFPERTVKQRARLNLPLLPTTTIGSFPQTADIRAARAAYRQGKSSKEDYETAMKAEIRKTVARQEALGLDVLVHGEAERNDMVEYFGEQLDGFVFTENGWVQSYGSRCVKPPAIYGDISRPRPMTVQWSSYAQGLTDKPMKGMLTGPITMLHWSFVRDDLPRRQVAMQLALALRAEVRDLEAAGIRIIQIDEPAIREGLPLKTADWPDYLYWAVRAFRIVSCEARPETQIHTHMCYSEFNDILPAIAAMDADVITIETSRSRMKLLDAFAEFKYPNDIGPGIYDIHSPRVPSAEEMQELLRRALQVVPAQRLWVNPDCGLKTRGWPETEAALARLVAAAREARERLPAEALQSKH